MSGLDKIPVARWVLEEARRCLFYSAREMRKQIGDMPLCECVEEEEIVRVLNGVLGDEITTDSVLVWPP